MDIDNKQLLRKISSGDEQAFEELFLKYYGPLARFGYRYVQSIHVSEELVQEVYARLWEIRDTIETRGSIRSWLYQSVKNSALDYIKHQKIVDKYEQEVSDSLYGNAYEIEPMTLGKDSFAKAVQVAIDELPEQAQHIYKLSRKDGLTYQEIAEILEVSPKTVESHMSKALRILRQRLSKFLPTLALVRIIERFVA